jgi:hypothetical protein
MIPDHDPYGDGEDQAVKHDSRDLAGRWPGARPVSDDRLLSPEPPLKGIARAGSHSLTEARRHHFRWPAAGSAW